MGFGGIGAITRLLRASALKLLYTRIWRRCEFQRLHSTTARHVDFHLLVFKGDCARTSEQNDAKLQQWLPVHVIIALRLSRPLLAVARRRAGAFEFVVFFVGHFVGLMRFAYSYSYPSSHIGG